MMKAAILAFVRINWGWLIAAPLICGCLSLLGVSRLTVSSSGERKVCAQGSRWGCTRWTVAARHQEPAR